MNTLHVHKRQPIHVRQAAPGLGSEFDDFLHARIVEDGNGLPLTVLSALARLNMDPWDEAARLAGMPRQTATGTLAALIAALPNAPPTRTASKALAASLVALLPGRMAASAPSADPAPVARHRIDVHALIAYYLIGMIVLFLAAHWFSGPPR